MFVRGVIFLLDDARSLLALLVGWCVAAALQLPERIGGVWRGGGGQQLRAADYHLSGQP